MPLNWKRGDAVIIPPSKTVIEKNKRIKDSSRDKIDFYLAKKVLQPEKVKQV